MHRPSRLRPAAARRLTLTALLLSACAVPPPKQAAPPPPLGREFVTDYNRIGRVVFGDSDKQWVVLPHAVAVFEDGVFRMAVDARAGLTGSIAAADQDLERIWLGTTEGVFALDKRGNYLK